MGAGMATLQVAVNPLLRVSGGEEHFAFNSAFAQLIFGLASFISPRLYSYLVGSLGDPAMEESFLLRVLGRLTPRNLPWASMYWIFVVSTLLMIVVLAFTRFPRVERKEDERAGSWQMYRDLLRKPIVWFFFLSVFAYVGSEQGTANWISEFLAKYHGYDPHTAGATAVSWFWGLLTAGCFIGMGLLKIFDSRKVLIVFAVLALLCLSAALFGSSRVALYAFPAVGLFASIMWPVLVSLALNKLVEKLMEPPRSSLRMVRQALVRDPRAPPPVAPVNHSRTVLFDSTTTLFRSGTENEALSWPAAKFKLPATLV
jgi:fucose permease